MDKSATAPDSTSSGHFFVWQDFLPWLIIVRALRPAVSFRLLILSASGWVATVAGWRLLAKFRAIGEAYASGKHLGHPTIVLG